jgi:5-methylcytosine-specific restriction protein A
MPVKYVCRSCRVTITGKGGYCDRCNNDPSVKKQKKGDRFYWSTRWLRFRDWYKRLHPLCEDCAANGRLVPVDVVDHVIEIKDGGAPLDENNARSLCHQCHARKTARVRAEREGRVESPPTPPAQPFGSFFEASAK